MAEQSTVVLENSTFKRQLSIAAQQISVTGSVAIEGNLFVLRVRGSLTVPKKPQLELS